MAARGEARYFKTAVGAFLKSGGTPGRAEARIYGFAQHESVRANFCRVTSKEYSVSSTESISGTQDVVGAQDVGGAQHVYGLQREDIVQTDFLESRIFTG